MRGDGETLGSRVALVIGGGSGLGREIALALAEAGAAVSVADLRKDAAESTASLVSGPAFAIDVADREACFGCVEQLVAARGRLDILVNCAAVCLVDRFLDVSPERWNRVFAVNALGSLICTQAAALAMIPNRFGRIIHTSTPASRLGFPLWASYGASKAAMDSMIRAAALELAPHGITVNSIVPGRMTGGMVDQLEKDVAALTGEKPSDLEEARTRSLPMRRRVDASEVARAAVWLASDAAGYVTASRFNFTGGMELS